MVRDRLTQPCVAVCDGFRLRPEERGHLVALDLVDQRAVTALPIHALDQDLHVLRALGRERVLDHGRDVIFLRVGGGLREHVRLALALGHLRPFDLDFHRLREHLTRRPVTDVAVTEVPGEGLARVGVERDVMDRDHAAHVLVNGVVLRREARVGDATLFLVELEQTFEAAAGVPHLAHDDVPQIFHRIAPVADLPVDDAAHAIALEHEVDRARISLHERDPGDVLRNKSA